MPSRQPSSSPSHVPTTAKPNGMGSRPGPKSLGDVTSCGGGGGAFGSKSPTQAIQNRNAGYGITGTNAYNDTNYVQAQPKFNPDGSLDPKPQFNLGC
jgi:hypothetical protein